MKSISSFANGVILQYKMHASPLRRISTHNTDLLVEEHNRKFYFTKILQFVFQFSTDVSKTELICSFLLYFLLNLKSDSIIFVFDEINMVIVIGAN